MFSVGTLSWNPTFVGGNVFFSLITCASAAGNISSVSPSSAIAGGPGFTVTVTGSGFVPGDVIQFLDFGLRTTVFISSTQLTAPVDPVVMVYSIHERYG
jgi:hypothetical protein